MIKRNLKKGKSLQNVEKREPVQIILQVPHATNVPMIQDVSNIEQTRAVKNVEK